MTMTPTEFEFTSGERIFRTYLINGKWRVTMTDHDQFFDRDQSREFMEDTDNNFCWSDFPRWRAAASGGTSFFDDLDNDSDQEEKKFSLAEFDSPEDAQEAVVWYFIKEDHDAAKDDDW